MRKKNLNYSSTSINNITKNFLKIIAVVFISVLVLKDMKIYANEVSKSDSNGVNASERVAQIRDTKNTDISNREGDIFYVSASGNDNNDGLTPETAWKTIDKVNEAFLRNIIKDKDTVLFNRGDVFRGSITVCRNEILIGSYGNEDLAKPEILVSPYDGAKEGVWTEVQDNIWKYTIDGENPFTSDVGAIWFYSDDKELSNKMENVEESFEFGQKITTDLNFDEESLDLNTILDSDLEFYHVGHATVRNSTGKELYLYSEENPSDRFSRIEFNIASHGIYVWELNNTEIDNLTIKYAGIHGISAGTVANLKVTNSEFGFIGGVTHSYSERDGKPVRLGNAVEIYGAVTAHNGYDVEDGFVVQNNYIYQIYDAGLTFQYTTDVESKIENVIFDNNVVEYCNYNVEYWNSSTSSDPEVQENTYINNFKITNNIMRYAGFGISQTRPDKKQSAHIKTWEYNENRVIGNYIISNNVFDTSSEQVFWICAGKTEYLPQITNNTIYNSYNVPLGYYFESENKFNIPYIKNNMEQILPNNTYYYLEDDLESYSGSGISGDVNWKFDSSTGTLNISGSGKMKDYSEDDLPEWYNSRMFIKKIVIGEDVSYMGKYAFYNLPYVEELEVNCKKLDDFSSSGVNTGDNFTFYKTGREWMGMDVTFGEEVTVVPAFMFWPREMDYETPKIKNLDFKGNKIKEIKHHAFTGLRVPVVVIPEGVETIGSLAISNTSYTKAISIPDTVKKIDPWGLAGNTGLEKIVFGKNINQINSCTLNGTHSLKEAIFTSDVVFNSNDYNGLFSTRSENTTVYGNDSAKKLVQDYSEKTTNSNIKYQNIDEYKINVNLNNDLLEIKNKDYKIGDNLELSVAEGYKINNIEIYQKYTALDGTVYTINKIKPSSMDSIEIPTNYWDIDILANISKIEDDKKDDVPGEDDKEDNVPGEDDKEDNVPGEDDKEDNVPGEDDKEDNVPGEDDKEDNIPVEDDKKDDITNEDNNEEVNNENPEESKEEKNVATGDNIIMWLLALLSQIGVIVVIVRKRLKKEF